MIDIFHQRNDQAWRRFQHMNAVFVDHVIQKIHFQFDIIRDYIHCSAVEKTAA